MATRNWVISEGHKENRRLLEDLRNVKLLEGKVNGCMELGKGISTNVLYGELNILSSIL